MFEKLYENILFDYVRIIMIVSHWHLNYMTLTSPTLLCIC